QVTRADIDYIKAAGEKAKANSRGTTEAEKEADAVKAQIRAAQELANKCGKNVPKSLERYLKKLGLVRDETGKWSVDIKKLPKDRSEERRVGKECRSRG